MIRLAKPDDAAAIAEITNHYIRTSTVTFYTEEFSVENRRQWLVDRSPRHPVFVAEESGQILGWACLAEHKPRQAYRQTAESSVYIRQGFHRRGLGKALMHSVIAVAREHGFHTLLAGMCAEAIDSHALHTALGFHPVARFEQVGWKFGRWLDVQYTQLMLGDNPSPSTPSRHG